MQPPWRLACALLLSVPSCRPPEGAEPPCTPESNWCGGFADAADGDGLDAAELLEAGPKGDASDSGLNDVTDAGTTEGSSESGAVDAGME